MEALIEARGISFTYQPAEDGAFVLQDLSLAIKPGEHLAIIGPNGSGKSTLLKHFNGLLVPTSGEVLVRGISTASENDRWLIRQRCGIVFQNPDNQIVATTVEEDVAFGLENLAVPSALIRRRVEQALEAVQMTAFARHAPSLLSGGQKQRVAIAGILAMQPQCLLLDEPTAMLDPHGREEVMKTIKRLNREQGITIVHVTHFMEEAMIAERVVVLHEGRIVLDGSPAEVFGQQELILGCGLDIPVLVELAQSLRRSGLPLPGDVLTMEQLVEQLCS